MLPHELGYHDGHFPFLHDPYSPTVPFPILGDDYTLWVVLKQFPEQVRERIAVILRRKGHGASALAREECPGSFSYGAGVVCHDGKIHGTFDQPADDDLPCPFHKPREATAAKIDGTTMKPVCRVDNKPLPYGTLIDYRAYVHDNDADYRRPDTVYELPMSAVCPEHGSQLVELREFDDDTAPWVAWPEGAPPHA